MSTTNPAPQTAEAQAPTAAVDAPAAAENPAVAEAASAPLPPEPAALDAAAARVDVKPPEAGIASESAAILPAPTMKLPEPPQSVATAPEHSSPAQAVAGGLIIMPAVLAEAEKHLAAYIGKAISPQLEPGLMLSLQSLPDKGATNLVLAFTGEMVAANASLLGEEVVAALRNAPQMKDLLAHQHTPQVRLHEGRLEVTIPHLSTAQYAHLVQALAGGIAAPEAEKNHTCTGAGCPQCGATKDAAPPADAPAGATPDTAQQPAPAVAEAATAPAIAAEVLQPPVAAAPAVAAETATSPLVEQPAASTVVPELAAAPAAVPSTLVETPAANEHTMQPAKAAGIAS
ncbi:MAG: hypothetical protein SFW64_02780 [Alphaproteobacteria bacterium]|nr:hypothetical protein [Alphaproteobacteria bacterium]